MTSANESMHSPGMNHDTLLRPGRGFFLAFAALLTALGVGPGVTPTVSADGPALITMTPGRLLDTRPGERTIDGQQQGSGTLPAQRTIEVGITGRVGIPADASAAMLNVTAVGPTAAGHLTVYPCGTNPPNTSSLNYAPGQVVANAVLSKIGTAGKICIFTHATSHIIVDVTGYVPAGGGGDDPGPDAPILTQLSTAFSEQQVTFDSAGTAHLVYVAEYGEEVWYAKCALNCSTQAGWASVKIRDLGDSSMIGTGGIGVDASGRVHLLLNGVPSLDPFAELYATCATNCTSSAGWSFTDLSGRAGEFLVPSYSSSVLMVTPLGTVSFVTTGFNDFVEREVRYLQCSSGCTSASNWSMTPLFVGAATAAVRHPNGTIHVAFADGTSALDNDMVATARCTTGCTNRSNWAVSPHSFPTADKADAARLAVTTTGRVYLGFPRGDADGQPMDDRYIVATCTSGNCVDLANWTATGIGESGEGVDGAWLATSGEQLIVSTVAGSTGNLLVRTCDSACHLSANYSPPAVMDTQEAVTAVMDPLIRPITCPDAVISYWPENPVIAATPSGRFIIVSAPYGLWQCPGMSGPSPLAPIGRIYATF